MIKKIFLLLVLSLLISPATFAYEIEVEKTQEKPNTTTYTNYRDCIKLYKLPYDKLFFLALSSIEANKFEIVEMQSRGGYIIFKAENKEFLITVLQKDKLYSFMKISPCDNNYYFSPNIPEKIFNQIALLFNAELKEIKL